MPLDLKFEFEFEMLQCPKHPQGAEKYGISPMESQCLSGMGVDKILLGISNMTKCLCVGNGIQLLVSGQLNQSSINCPDQTSVI